MQLLLRKIFCEEPVLQPNYLIRGKGGGGYYRTFNSSPDFGFTFIYITSVNIWCLFINKLLLQFQPESMNIQF